LAGSVNCTHCSTGKGQSIQKEKKKIDAFVLIAISAKDKLVQKKNDLSKLSKQEICSLSFFCYNETVKDMNILKSVLVSMLQAKIIGNPYAILLIIAV